LHLIVFRKYFNLSTVVNRFWNRMKNKSFLLVYAYNSMLAARISGLSDYHGYYFVHFSNSYDLYIYNSDSMHFRSFAVHFCIHWGASPSILPLILNSAHIFKSSSVNFSNACSIKEFLKKKHVFLSTSWLYVRLLASYR
jgi:hypothetical protein